ncbi:MAG: indolepyruvate oxidoreductase subunit beta [Candidatus Phosphoribacter sp.]
MSEPTLAEAPVPRTPPTHLPRLDVVLVGVGGQGTILASNVLAELGIRAGYDVKKAEVHGMSQRGGSVVSHVRWGTQVFSPIIPPGGADILVAFEKMEAARYAALLAPGGAVLINDHSIEPITVITGGAHYPEDAAIESAFGGSGQRLVWVHGARVANDLGNRSVANVVLLGALSTLLGLPVHDWTAVLDRLVKASYRDLNHQAFAAGRAELLAGPASGSLNP